MSINKPNQLSATPRQVLLQLILWSVIRAPYRMSRLLFTTSQEKLIQQSYMPSLPLLQQVETMLNILVSM